MRITSLIFMAGVTLWTPLVSQGQPGTNLSVEVGVVSLGRSSDTIRVDYIVSNSPSSQEQLASLTIDAPSEPFAITVPSPTESWLTASRYGERPVVRWAVIDESTLRPGTQSPVLSFKAVGLPTIVDAYIKGSYELPPMSEDEIDSLSSRDPLSVRVRQRVVGVEPTPPASTPSSLTTRLDALTGQACTLAWITQASLCTTLRGHLTAQPARLTSFRDDLAAGHTSGGPVKDNAFWLLKVNAEYILSLLPGQASAAFFLAGSGGTANPPTLSLAAAAPTATTAKYKDSPVVAFSGGNPWVQIGTWTAQPALASGTLSALGSAQVWLGLKNSDDFGTNYDVRTEVYKNGTLVASGQALCIQGITRNPDLAKQVGIAFGAFSPAAFNGTTDVLSLKVFTRIGTTSAGASCGGHSSALGLRLYFEAVNRAAKFDATF